MCFFDVLVVRYEPPAIPYLGMYLSDLSFIEEGTNNITEDGLVNFSKMRMVRTMIDHWLTNEWPMNDHWMSSASSSFIF